MPKPSKHDIALSLIRRHGRTFARELGIRIERNTPSPLFRLLCFALLASARIGHDIAMDAARALSDHGWTTPKKMAGSTWAQRTRVLNRAGYARYDESTSRMLGNTTELLLGRYRGDLRRLRQAAGRDPAEEHRLLKEFKGIGDVGADIFLREAQLAWPELFPFADDRVLDAARRLGLGDDARALTRLVDGPKPFTRLAAALVRTRLADDFDAVVDAA